MTDGEFYALLIICALVIAAIVDTHPQDQPSRYTDEVNDDLDSW